MSFTGFIYGDSYQSWTEPIGPIISGYNLKRQKLISYVQL